jgi:hypothetical protein
MSDKQPGSLMAKQPSDPLISKREARIPASLSGIGPEPALREVGVGAFPGKEVGDHEATTRKVTNLQENLVTPATPTGASVSAGPWRFQIWHAVVVAVVIAGGIVLAAWLRKGTSTTSKVESVPAAAIPAILPVNLDIKPQPPAQLQPEQLPAPKTIRLEIGVEPKEAMLTLDDALVGNQLVVEAPKDHSIHVLKASAPGFLPFSQKISYSSDVRLVIQLRQARSSVLGLAKPHIGKMAGKSQTPHLEANPAEAVRPPPAPVKPDVKLPPALPQAPEPGANLGHPSPRRTSKQIDEKDPYAR